MIYPQMTQIYADNIKIFQIARGQRYPDLPDSLWVLMQHKLYLR